MPDWQQRIRSQLRLDGLEPQRQEEIVEDLAGQLEDAFQDALTRGASPAAAEAFAWDQCPDWEDLSRQLRGSRRGAIELHARMQAHADDAASAGRPRWLLGGLSDLLFAVRMMRKAPVFTGVAVLTLALGIGANTTIFSIINATLLKTLPFPEPDRLVLVWQTRGKGPNDINIVSAPNFWDWERRNSVFERMAVFDSAGKGYSLGAGGEQREAEQVSGLRVSSGFFTVLGVKPFLGREFMPEEEAAGRDRVVILSHSLWERRYGADRGIVGRPIRIDGENYVVVGVMPRGFEFQFLSDSRELWVPAGWTRGDHDRGSNSFIAIARLDPGVAVAKANADIAAIHRQLALQYEEDRGWTATVMPMQSFGVGDALGIALTLLAAVAFVLLIGCVNVANLMLARGAERRKEFAIRRALGASGTRILRQLLVESLLLAGLGGAGGLAVAYWCGRGLTAILPPDFAVPLRSLDAVALDGRVLGFTLAVACATAVLFGMAPALAAARGSLRQPLTEGGRGSGSGGRNRVRHILVAAEVGLALVVLASAGLMIKSMARLLAVEPGFDPRNVLTMEIALPQQNTYYGPPGRPRFCQDLDERVAGIPGVQSVGAAAHLPLRGNAGRSFRIEGRPEPPPDQEPGGSYSVACPGYFRTLGVRVLEGREFTHQDTLGSPGVVVINDALAKRYWPDEDPIGRRVSIGAKGDPQWLTIVGIVGNVRHWGLSRDIRPQLFRPYTQAAWPWMQIVVRTATAPETFAPAVKRAMAAVEPDRALSSPYTMERTVRQSVGSRRFFMLMLTAFASLALLLAAVGIVGVVSYAVTQRTHEVGIRLALGAQRKNVVWMMVRSSMKWVLAGVALGAAASLGATRVLATMLFDVKPADPWVLSAVAALLAATALVASYLPARRATRIDPLDALRSE